MCTGWKGRIRVQDEAEIHVILSFLPNSYFQLPVSCLTSNAILSKESALSSLQLSVNKFKTAGLFLLKTSIGMGLTLWLS